MNPDQTPAADSAFTPARVLRTREQVELQLREAIFSGTFSHGDKLPSEAELSEQFAVSRTTVREALRALASEGLIRKVPGAGGGSFVETVDNESLGSWLTESMKNILRLGSISHDEIAQTRRMLELPAASAAATERSEEDLETLRAVIEREKQVTVEDPSVSDLDVAFHTALAEASGNRVLSAFVSALHRVTHPVTYLHLSPETGRETVRQHVAILEAIGEQDPERARGEMERHLDYVESLGHAPNGAGTE
ncbi:MAG TPA: FadR/GntR family transcriptional regulator [Solirubrobacterales bacterium]|nr:FadR/GntR family transcriptional regulator [Solirubrobacterales bacterium]